MVKNIIVKKIIAVLLKMGIQEDAPLVEHPTNLRFGDYSTNVALKHAKSLGKNPYELAVQIKDAIETVEEIEKIEVVKPGFVNFWLSKKVLIQQAQSGQTHQKQNKQVLLEFGQPNTHKLPHLGHLFSYIYGESLARILEHQGNTLYRLNYQGDIGLHVAKCLYILRKKIDQKALSPDVFKSTDRDGLFFVVTTLQKCYQKGAQLYEDDERAKSEIDELNRKIYSKDPEIVELWKITRDANEKFYEQVLEKDLEVNYLRHYWEDETASLGKQIVAENTGTIFEKSEGATVFKGEKYGLHTRVFINKYGNATYEAKDVGLIALKQKEYPNFDISLVTTAAEQNEYWKVIKQVTELIFPALKNKIKHLGFGMINLTTGKMSSRTGNVVDALGIINLVSDKIQELYGMEQNAAKKIAIAAIKYSFLRSDAFSNITFDSEKSISKEGDSGPYILYTYVRCASVLKTEKNTSSLPDIGELNDEELIVLRKLQHFEEVVEHASLSYSPHLISNYIFDLAQSFNLFYQKHQILKTDSRTKNFRLFLTQSVMNRLKQGLYLLGIETVEKM